MRPRLLHPERDPVLTGRLPRQARALVDDLELRPLIDAMSRGDAFVADVARQCLLRPSNDIAEITYRQRVLADCLANADLARSLFTLATTALERAEQTSWAFMPRRPESVVRFSRDVLQEYLRAFRELRRLTDEHAESFASPGLRSFFAMVRQELDDAFLREFEGQLRELRFEQGIRVSARLGTGNKATDHVLLRATRLDRLVSTRLGAWVSRLRGSSEPHFTYQLEQHDEGAVRAHSELRDKALEEIAEVLAGATDHVIGFFSALRTQMAFYVGCLNLAEGLAGLGAPTCVPEPLPIAASAHSAQGLYDASLALTVGRQVVDNDLDADGITLVLLTGANQGGKTTLLRSVGVAQLLMQSGAFVPARSYRASVAPGVFTHFRREEDASMSSGKLDEELARMSDIVDELAPGSLLLLNESFSATNEREGSEIARQIVGAVTEAGTRVFFVTHLSEYARERFEQRRSDTLCLLAERRPDGARTFKLRAGAPQVTSHGSDVYREVFEAEASPTR